MGLSVNQLAELWTDAGGSPERARLAASIAWAESAGEPLMLGPGNRVGLWMPPVVDDNGGPAVALMDPLENAWAAVLMSQDGTDWSAFPGCQGGISARTAPSRVPDHRTNSRTPAGALDVTRPDGVYPATGRSTVALATFGAATADAAASYSSGAVL